jgi:plastocyanin
METDMPEIRAILRTPLIAAMAATACGVAALAIAQATVPSGPNKLAFPDGWEKGEMYATVDRYDNKQYREFYASPEVVKAVREGKPIPYGAVLTLAAYAAKLDAAGVPVKDASGRFVKDKLVAVNSMMKGQGFGADIPAAIRNGDWIYQSFTPDGKVNDKANLTACFQCHLPFAKDDYLTNMAKLAGKFPPETQAVVKGGAGEVTINDFKFGPETLKVSAGQKVTWVNTDNTPHQVSVVGENGQRSDLMLKGQSATMQFDAAGNIAYICGLHPGMKGTIEVAAK